MVTHFGMSPPPGLRTYGRWHKARYLGAIPGAEERNTSEQTAQQIDAEVRRIMDAGYQRVKEILVRRREELDLLAQELVRKETLDRAELDALPAREPAARGSSRDRPETESGIPPHREAESRLRKGV